MQHVIPPSTGVIPIVLPASEDTVAYSYATIQSGLQNTLPGVRLAIYLLHEDLSANKQQIGKKLFNATRSEVHFIDVKEWMEKYSPYIINDELRISFYRIAIPTLFKNFRRVLYINNDVLIRSCPSLLYYSIPKNTQIGATRDLLLKPAQSNGFCTPPEIAGGVPLQDYHKGALGVLDSDQYFQDGILIFNTENINEEKAHECGLLCSTLFMMHDQDILNRAFYGNVHFTHQNWNVCIGPGCEVASQELPNEWLTLYQQGLQTPFTVQFTGHPKPWNGWNGPYTDDFRSILSKIEPLLI